MTLSIRSFAMLVQTQAAAMQARCRLLIDFSVGSVLRAIVEGNAAIGLWLQGEILKVLKTTRAGTSEGTDLDTFVADFGLARLGAQAALGQVTFSRFTPGAQAIVPIGALVRTADNAQEFQVIVDATHPSYNAGLGGYVVPVGIFDVTVPVAAVASGAAGNVQPGTVAVIVAGIPFIDTVTNAAAFTGGGDQESDAELRQRFVAFIAQLRKGTIPAIHFAVTSLRRGIQATVIENREPDGITEHKGFLTVTVDDGSGAPPATLVSEAYAAADNVRAGGIRFGVFSPIAITADVEVNLVIADTFDPNTVIAQVGLAIAGYIDALPLGEPLYWSRLPQIAFNASPGVKAVPVVKINGLTADLPATQRNKIVRGAITVA